MIRRVMRLAAPLRQPWQTAHGALERRELAILRLEDEERVAGFGEAAPLTGFDGVDVKAVADELERDAAESTFARAAEEMAMLDLSARREGQPLLAEAAGASVEVNRSIPALPAREAARRAEQGAAMGYRVFKVKVGLAEDAERVAAVRRAVGDDALLRIDANAAWAEEEAVERLRALGSFGIELVEQPCASLEEMASVREAVPEVPIAADESVRSGADVERAASLGACSFVALKLSACGGVGPTRELMKRSRELGLGVYLASALDGPWGISAALHVAAAEGVDAACGLATLELFEGPLAEGLPAPADGRMAVPRGPGLGVSVKL